MKIKHTRTHTSPLPYQVTQSVANPPAASKGGVEEPKGKALITNSGIPGIEMLAVTSNNINLKLSSNELNVFHLDLTKYETDGIETILKKLKTVDKIKITGLRTYP